VTSQNTYFQISKIIYSELRHHTEKLLSLFFSYNMLFHAESGSLNCKKYIYYYYYYYYCNYNCNYYYIIIINNSYLWKSPLNLHPFCVPFQPFFEASKTCAFSCYRIVFTFALFEAFTGVFFCFVMIMICKWENS